MEQFKSTKVIDGFSTCFRQWKAEDTHCKFLHGYAISFHVTFEGFLDHRNWVMDFGFMKRSKTKIMLGGNVTGMYTPDEFFKAIFDHTVVVAKDDPDLPSFLELNDMKIAQVRVLESVGCEMFAKFVYEQLNSFLKNETQGRVSVVRVECFEHSKNSAIYETAKTE